MGTCHWCNLSLLADADKPEASTWTDEVISGELETLCAALSGDFGDQRNPRSEPLCSWLLREGRQRSPITSPESIARISGLGLKLLSQLEYSAEVNCSLQDLVRLCVTLGIGVQAAIRRDFAGFSRQPLLLPLQHASVKYGTEGSVTPDQVRRHVIGLLRKGELPTVTQLQIRYRVPTAKMLDLLGPKLRARMKHRMALFRQGQMQERRSALVENIVATRKALLAMCQPADAAAVATALGRRYSKARNFRAAFAQAMLVCG